jgi:hypothetical protein
VLKYRAKRNAAPLVDDRCGPGDGHVQVHCQLVHSQLQRLEEILTENFSGVNRRKAVAEQRFQPVPWGRDQIPQFGCAVELPEFAPRYKFNRLKPLAAPPMVQLLGLFAAKRLDHAPRR